MTQTVMKIDTRYPTRKVKMTPVVSRRSHIQVLTRHVPRLKARIQDPQYLATKQNVKIQDLQDRTTKSLSHDPRSPGFQDRTKI